MSIDNQIEIPPSFIALYVTPGRSTPNAPHETVIARYELCEDMASTLIEHAQTLAFNESLSESAVLTRCHQGLLADVSAFAAGEAWWVITRLAEMLGWEALAVSPRPGSAAGAVPPGTESKQLTA